MKVHPSHETRMSDASTFDEICTKCGATDTPGSSALELPCPKKGAGDERPMRPAVYPQGPGTQTGPVGSGPAGQAPAVGGVENPPPGAGETGRRSVPDLLNTYASLLNEYGPDSAAAEAFVSFYRDREEFVHMAATARWLKRVLDSAPLTPQRRRPGRPRKPVMPTAAEIITTADRHIRHITETVAALERMRPVVAAYGEAAKGLPPADEARMCDELVKFFVEVALELRSPAPVETEES